MQKRIQYVIELHTTDIIINGKPLKSINHYYNRKLSNLKSKIGGKRKTSKKINKLTNKRNHKVSDYLHKSSRYIINHLVSNNINTLIIGKNDGWKQEINIGKRNNQNFVQIILRKAVPNIIFDNGIQEISVSPLVITIKE